MITKDKIWKLQCLTSDSVNFLFEYVGLSLCAIDKVTNNIGKIKFLGFDTYIMLTTSQDKKYIKEYINMT